MFRPSAASSLVPLLVVPLALVLTLEVARHAWYKVGIPSELSVRAIYLPRILGATCEVSVWALNEAEATSPMVFTEWVTTPHPVRPSTPFSQDSWLNGIGCSAAPSPLKDAVIGALADPGSYYRAGPRSGLVFVPSYAYVVQSFNRN